MGESNRTQGAATPEGKVVIIGGLKVQALGTEASFLRGLYNQGYETILDEARKMVAAGRSEEVAARWVVEQRNALKVAIRKKGPKLFKRLAEVRNQQRYKNPVGPSYEQLKAKGLTDAEIISGSKKTSQAFNKSGGRLRLLGKGLGGVGFVLQAMQGSPASSSPLPRSKAEQVEIERTRLRLGIPATANIDRHGHLKPGFYLQVGDVLDPHGFDAAASETEEILWWFGIDITYEHRGHRWTVPGRSWW